MQGLHFLFLEGNALFNSKHNSKMIFSSYDYVQNIYVVYKRKSHRYFSTIPPPASISKEFPRHQK